MFEVLAGTAAECHTRQCLVADCSIVEHWRQRKNMDRETRTVIGSGEEMSLDA